MGAIVKIVVGLISNSFNEKDIAMSVFTPIRKNKVHPSEYIRTEYKQDGDDARPTEPTNPKAPAAE